MLKGIPKILGPELLKTLMEMGHGDELLLCDGNYPRLGHPGRLIRCDGRGVPELLDAILRFMPLDTYVDYPVILMEVKAGDPYVPEIWGAYRQIIETHQPGTRDCAIDRFEFYKRGTAAYAALATGEKALYANIILKKGVVVEPVST
ncbi:MAG: fucose isomerase [Treponema sp.]|jgi:L-fucose mutarotase|nr:fucose isomerase [Treponema sp.]